MIVRIVGSVLLVLVAALTPRKRPSLILGLTYGVALGLVWLITLNLFDPLKPSFPDAVTTRVAQFGSDRLKRDDGPLGQYCFLDRREQPDIARYCPLPLRFPGDPSKTDLKIYHSTMAWVAARDAEYGKLFENVGATPCFFGVTSWSAPMYRYDLWFSQSPKHQAFFNGDGEALRESFADPRLWADERHLKRAGARIFTQAFANYFIDAIKKHQL